MRWEMWTKESGRCGVFDTEVGAAIALGRYAERHRLLLEWHKGEWTVSSYATASKPGAGEMSAEAWVQVGGGEPEVGLVTRLRWRRTEEGRKEMEAKKAFVMVWEPERLTMEGSPYTVSEAFDLCADSYLESDVASRRASQWWHEVLRRQARGEILDEMLEASWDK